MSESDDQQKTEDSDGNSGLREDTQHLLIVKGGDIISKYQQITGFGIEIFWKILYLGKDDDADPDLSFPLFLLLIAGLVIASLILISHTIVLVQNNPVMTTESIGFGDLSTENITTAANQLNAASENSNPNFGWTFGDPGKPAFKQSFIIIPPVGSIMAIWPIIVLSIFLLSIIAGARLWKSRSIQRSIWPNIAVIIFTVLGYPSLMILIFNLHPKISYITNAGVKVTSIFGAHTSFYMLLLLQGALLSITTLVWSQPVLPIDSDVQPKIHLDNWRTFGTWIGTFFGVVGITITLAFIKNIDLGFLFIRHVLLLFGILIPLNMGFVAYKLRRMELCAGKK